MFSRTNIERKRLVNPHVIRRRKIMRVSVDLKTYELAERFGVSKTFYSYWENGLRTSARLQKELIALYLRRTAELKSQKSRTSGG